jgi:hypothetical protein
MYCLAQTTQASGFDWVGIVLIPIAISLIVGVYIGRLMAYQQMITNAVGVAVEFATTGACKTYAEMRNMTSSATTKLTANSLVLLAMKHREASAEILNIATSAKKKTDGYINESARNASSDVITDEEWIKLNASITGVANHVSKRLASVRTPWWNYFRFQLLTRKEVGIEGDDWHC